MLIRFCLYSLVKYREDMIVLSNDGAIIEKGLVLHGCKPSVRVGDTVIAVNSKQFDTNEDFTQVC